MVSAFVVVSIQFGQFLVSCSSIHGASRAQPFVKVGGGWSTCPPYTPMESAPRSLLPTQSEINSRCSLCM